LVKVEIFCRLEYDIWEDEEHVTSFNNDLLTTPSNKKEIAEITADETPEYEGFSISFYQKKLVYVEGWSYEFLYRFSYS
jgi:hypothetical protein